jgi:hypothetical protein
MLSIERLPGASGTRATRAVPTDERRSPKRPLASFFASPVPSLKIQIDQ